MLSVPWRPILVSFLLLGARIANAEFDIRCYVQGNCESHTSPRTANPSKGSQIRINPSAVPTERGLGLEGIYYQGDTDLAIVQGLGRVGAAISPSNSEETFFGSPGLENIQDFYERKLERRKYPSHKITLAAAAEIIKRNDSSLRSFGLKLGLMGRYNRETKATNPGAGLNAVFGPIAVGLAVFKDETQLTGVDPLLGLETKTVIPYTVQTSSIGLYLNSFILDYSQLRLETTELHQVSTVSLLTGTLMVKRFIFTLAERTETSAKPNYDFETEMLKYEEQKTEYFGGFQFSVNKHFVLGILYNYYLSREFAAVGTFFF